MTAHNDTEGRWKRLRRGSNQSSPCEGRLSMISQDSRRNSISISSAPSPCNLAESIIDQRTAEDIDIIVSHVTRHSVILSSVERALLDDMASANNESRWKNRVPPDKLHHNLDFSKSQHPPPVDAWFSRASNEECGSSQKSKLRNDYHIPSTNIKPQPVREKRRVSLENSTVEVDCNGTWSCCSNSIEMKDQHPPREMSEHACSQEKGKRRNKSNPPNIRANENEVAALSSTQIYSHTHLACSSTAPNSPPRDDFDQPATISKYFCWDSSDLCVVRDSKRNVRTADDVSSIASSSHSGRLPSKQTTPSFVHRRKNNIHEKKVDGLASSFNNWPFVSSRTSIRFNSKLLTETFLKSSSLTNLDDDFEDDEVDDENEDYLIEEKYYAMNYVKRKEIISEACDLMGNVNKAVLAMGMEPPFRPIDEVIPLFKQLHRNLGYQMDDLGATVKTHSWKHVRLRHRKKSLRRSSASSNVSCSIRSLSSYSLASPNPPPLEDHKAVASYIMHRISAPQMLQQNSPPSCVPVPIKCRQDALDHPEGIKLYSSYLPNFMWYQPIATDSSCIMRPTSLCSGTGISGGHQFLKPDMLSVFSMFGSYFIGAFGTFTDSEVDRKNRRAAFWIESDDESSLSSEASDRSCSSEESSHAKIAEDALANQLIPTQMQMLALERAIEDLLRSRDSPDSCNNQSSTAYENSSHNCA